MAIRPQPTLYRCPKCGWKDVFAPHSDAMVERPWEECPKCGERELDRKPVGMMDMLSKKLFGK